MFLISLILAATSQPAVKPDVVQRREPARSRRAQLPARSKRLIELEATVKSLPLAADERGQGGPEGL
jgi:hypothetical protein